MYRTLVFIAVTLCTLANPVAAELQYTQDIAFNAVGRNPYSNDPEWKKDSIYTLFDESFRADIPPINANPTQIAVDLLADFLDLPLPDLVRARVGASVAGHANLSFGYYVTAGRLDIAYPAGANLNFQTAAEGDFVTTNNSYTIDATFLPGRERVIPIELAGIAGAGYLDDPLQGIDFNSYSVPTFATTSPWASAWLDASADVHASLFASVSALGGLLKGRKDFRVNVDTGQRTLIEIDPTGLYVGEEKLVGYDITQPIGPIPVGGGVADLTIQIPKLGLASNVPAVGASVVTAHAVKPILTLQGNMEQLIPFLGPILHRSLVPFEYDLLQLKGGPVVSMYQDMTFTPKPQLRLQFSEPVMVRGSDGQFHETYDEVIALNQAGQPAAPFEWLPMFSNSAEITISPTYILDNTFRNETGLQFSLQVDVEALGLDTPFPAPADHLGPAVNESFTIDIGPPIELFTPPEFRIDIPNVTARPIVIEKRNLSLAQGAIGDLSLFSAAFVGRDASQNELYQLDFVSELAGGLTRDYHATIPAIASDIAYPPDVEGASTILTTLADVILIDSVSNEPFNLGRRFCIGGCDTSQFQLAANPFYSAQPDPSLPGFDPIYVSVLPDLPNTDVDAANHPVLGQRNVPGVTVSTDSLSGTAVTDWRDQPATTIILQSTHLNPEGDGEFGQLSRALLRKSGDVVVPSILNLFRPLDQGTTPAIYIASGQTITKVAREGDPVIGGGRVDLGEEEFGLVTGFNASGEIAFQSRGREFPMGVVRAGPAGVTRVVDDRDLLPSGNEYFFFTSSPVSVSINDGHQVAFAGRWSLEPDVDPSVGGIGIFQGDENGLTEIVRTGQALPGMAGTVSSIYSGVSALELKNSGQLAFGVTTTTEEHGIYRSEDGTLTPIVRLGDNAPDNGRFLLKPDPFAMNEAGQVYFSSEVEALSSGNEVWTAGFLGDGESIREIFRLGQVAPDGDGTIDSVFDEKLNDQGRIAFQAEVSGAERYSAMMTTNGVELMQIARSGDSIPGGNGVFAGFGREGVFPSFAINNAGHVAFEARLGQTPGSSDGDDAIFVFDGTNLVQIAREGQSLAGSTVVNLQPFASSLSDGFNDAMQVAYTALLADGSQVIARFEPENYWRNRGSGDWATAANWSLLVEPTDPYDVFIVAEEAFTVSGPQVDRLVKSLTLGGEQTAIAELNLVDGITLAATNGTTIRSNGVLSGNGTLAGDVWNLAGTVSPGNSPGELHIEGDYVQDSFGALLLELAGPTSGTDYDVLSIAGSVELQGDVFLSFLGGYSPELGTQFNLIQFGGEFDASQATFHVVGAPGGLQLTSYVRNGVFGLSASSVPEPNGLSLALLATQLLGLVRPYLSHKAMLIV